MQRFFVPPDLDLTPGASVQLPAELTHQVGRVLRYRPGDRIILLDGAGQESEIELTEFAPGSVRGLVRAQRRNDAEPNLHVTLYQCVLKGEKLELVLQKCVELGVSAFTPVLSERVVAQGDALGGNKGERLQRIVREAAEQSGRGKLPVLQPILKWQNALADARAKAALTLVPWEKADKSLGIAQALAGATPSQAVALFIGPEGGLTEQEAQQAVDAGAKLVTLGPRILRAETAAIAAATLLLLGRLQ